MNFLDAFGELTPPPVHSGDPSDAVIVPIILVAAFVILISIIIAIGILIDKKSKNKRADKKHADKKFLSNNDDKTDSTDDGLTK